MIRRALKSIARRALDRPEAAPAPPPVAPEPPAPEVGEDEGPVVDVEGPAVKAWVVDGKNPVILDIREPYELSGGYTEGALLIPMNDVPDHLGVLPRDRPLVVACAAGVRSFAVAHYLREQGFEDAWSLEGGIGAWAAEGARWVQPPYPAPRFALTWRVQLSAEAAAARGLGVGPHVGTIQHITGPADSARYTVGLAGEGTVSLVTDLAEADLSPAPRAR